jgi:hypothetical protein
MIYVVQSRRKTERPRGYDGTSIPGPFSLVFVRTKGQNLASHLVSCNDAPKCVSSNLMVELLTSENHSSPVGIVKPCYGKLRRYISLPKEPLQGVIYLRSKRRSGGTQVMPRTERNQPLDGEKKMGRSNDSTRRG